MNHAGNKGNVSVNKTNNLYREITLELPTSAKVRSTIAPDVHLKVDLNQYLSGTNKITLDASNDGEMGSSDYLVKVTDNFTKAFSVDHVHND